MDRDDLKKLIDEDELGLLNLKTKASAAGTSEERLVTSFREINDFVRKTGREPQPNRADIREMMLYSRLSSLREDMEKVKVLTDHDEFGLLGTPKKAVGSVEDIFSDDDLGILGDAAENIFQLKNVPVIAKEINTPDYVARRKPCNDFEAFEP
ncbi:MAG: GIY-YIG nuclease family protein, partial [Ktedonobacteraceae bacterium]